MKHVLTAFCILAILTTVALASDSTSNPNLMPLDQVRPGMKGYGMSVFQGSKPERFEVEVLGTLEGVPNPKQSLVIARLSGALVDRTGVFAGMSGSPVYIDDKLVGAVAYAFPFSKEAIAGIQPIQNMVGLVEKGSEHEARPSSTPLSFSTLLGKVESSTSTLSTLSGVRA